MNRQHLHLISTTLLLTLSIIWIMGCSIFRSSQNSVVIPFTENGLIGFENSKGEVLTPPQFDSIASSFYHDYGVFCRDGKCALVRSDGTVITPAIYDRINSVYLGRTSVHVRKDGFWGIIDLNGQVILSPKNDMVYGFMEGYCISRRADKWGVLDSHDREVIPFEYDQISPPKGGLFQVRKGRIWGMLNTSGEVAIPIEYRGMTPYNVEYDLIGVRKNEGWGFINSKNEVVIPFEFGYCQAFGGKITWASKDQKWGIIDTLGKALLPFQFDFPVHYTSGITMLNDQIIRIRLNGKEGVMNLEGDTLVSPKFNHVALLGDSLAYAETDSFYGYIQFPKKESLWPLWSNHQELWETITPAPKSLPNHTDSLDYSINYLRTEITEILKQDSTSSWSLEKILFLRAEALREEPKIYPGYSNFKAICANYGIWNSGNFTVSKYGPGWERFKKETLFAIVASEELRETTWNWLKPTFRHSFQSMHPQHQRTYLEGIEYLRDYINHYQAGKMKRYLKENPWRFANYDPDGNKNPWRKSCATVDRLILVHEVMTEKEARQWINKIADEVQTWVIDVPN
ncbi:WG repeat-containing protein [bacterium SCSIO 12741]|nr:WG repeat-containing protein [bacterium SCSIO 12741]